MGRDEEVQAGHQRQREQDLFQRALVRHRAQLGRHHEADATECKIDGKETSAEVWHDEHEPAEAGKAGSAHHGDGGIGHFPAAARDHCAGNAEHRGVEAYDREEPGDRQADRQREVLKQEADRGCGVAQRQHCQMRPLPLVTPQHEKCAGNHQRYRRIEQRYEEAGFQATVALCLRKSIVVRCKQMVKPLLRSPALCEGPG